MEDKKILYLERMLDIAKKYNMLFGDEVEILNQNYPESEDHCIVKIIYDELRNPSFNLDSFYGHVLKSTTNARELLENIKQYVPSDFEQFKKAFGLYPPDGGRNLFDEIGKNSRRIGK